MAWWNPFSWFAPPIDETWDDAEAAYDAANPDAPIVPYFDRILGEMRERDTAVGGGVTETRVQEMIDDSLDGAASFYAPVANYLVNDVTYGAVYYLDSTIPSIVFAERLLGLKKVRLRLVSANPAVTGNIVIVPAVDGVDQTPVTLAVGATAETCEIEFTVAVTGRFALRRDYAAAADTLDDVTAIVTVLRILEV